MAEGSAPASSANLGPAFDTLALALDLRCRVSAELAPGWSIVHHGPERFESKSGNDAVLEAARAMSASPLAIEVFNDIPLSRGLGSSAAAFAAGVMAAGRAVGASPTQDDVFERAEEFEGHPDNAAAAAYGGLVGCSDGKVLRLELSDRLHIVIGVPGHQLATRDARMVLPRDVPLPVVSRTLGRTVALIEGLRTGNHETLVAARGDELHELPRAALSPAVGKVMDAATAAGASHAAWSGAGPSVLAITTAQHRDTVIEAISSVLGEGGRVLTPLPDRRGVV